MTYQFIHPPEKIQYPCEECERRDLRTIPYAMRTDITPCGLPYCPKLEESKT